MNEPAGFTFALDGWAAAASIDGEIDTLPNLTSRRGQHPAGMESRAATMAWLRTRQPWTEEHKFYKLVTMPRVFVEVPRLAVLGSDGTPRGKLERARSPPRPPVYTSSRRAARRLQSTFVYDRGLLPRRPASPNFHLSPRYRYL